MSEGGWTSYRKCNPDDCQLFGAACKEMLSHGYKPQYVATQVVGGTNYSFICEGTEKTSPPQVDLFKVTGFEPLHGKLKLKSFEKIEP
ncbi:MAG: hypothetical protein MI749_08585 [Desulfovibrionales bacterium]|nr:hypothetical protein [Desulfovibrionales bacterium]